MLVKKWGIQILLIFLLVAWGCSYPLMRIGVLSLGPFTLNFFRFLLGTMVLILVLLIRDKKVNLSSLSLTKIFILGSIQTFLLFGLSGLGIQFIDSGETSILLYTMPIWTMILSVVFLGEKLYFARVLGILLSFLGLVTIFGNKAFFLTDTMSIVGYALVILAAIVWALSNIYFKLNFSDQDPLLITAAQMAIGCLMLGIVAFLFESDNPNFQMNMDGLWVLLYLGIFASAICFVIWFYLIQNINLATLSLASLLVPIISIIVGAISINEPITINKVFGSIILLAGVVYSQLFSPK